MSKPDLFAITGMKQRKSEEFVKGLAQDTEVMLVREPKNPWDSNAIQVWTMRDGAMAFVGYIPKAQNATLARRIDQDGKNWTKPIETSTPTQAIGDSVEIFRAMPAKIHKGNNSWPLVEVPSV